MVTFVCTRCNESLPKRKVSTHACFPSAPVSCVDCGRVFAGPDHARHTTCVSESAKYGADRFGSAVERARADKARKAAAVADAWAGAVLAAVEKLDGEPRSALQRCVHAVGADKVPTNQKRFANFVKSTCPRAGEGVVRAMWDTVQRERAASAPPAAEVEADAKPDPVAIVERAKQLLRESGGEAVRLKRVAAAAGASKKRVKLALKGCGDLLVKVDQAEEKRVVVFAPPAAAP